MRQQSVAQLSVLAAKINADPEDTALITEAFQRVLDIASHAPGGQQALIDGLRSCNQAQEVLAFCKMFTSVVAIYSGGGDGGESVIEPVHDERIAA